MTLEAELDNVVKRKIEGSVSLRKVANRLYRKSGSNATVETYLAYLSVFFKWLNLKPDEALVSNIKWEDKLNDYIDYVIIEKKLSRNYARTSIFAVKKWLELNNILFEWNKVESPKVWLVERDRVPTREELKTILSYADLSTKAMILISLSSGLRIGTLLSLRMRDIQLDQDIPIISIRSEMSKDRPRGYITFMSREAKAHLLAYIKERKMRGEDVNGESYVIAGERPRGKRIGYTSAQIRWVKILRRADKDFKERRNHTLRLHVLRKYFRSWCSLSGIDSTLIEMWMGHRSSISQVYFVSGIEDLSNLELLKRFTKEYEKALPCLEIFNEGEKVKELEGKIDDQAQAFQKEKERFEAEKRSWENRFNQMEKMLTELIREDKDISRKV